MGKVGSVPDGWFGAADPAGEPDTAHRIVRQRRFMVRGLGVLNEEDSYENGELVLAALAYMVSPGEEIWPFDPADFHPGDPAENMVQAGAFLAAEGDRITRGRLEGREVSSGLIVLGLDPEDVDRCVTGLRSIKDQIREIAKDFPSVT